MVVPAMLKATMPAAGSMVFLNVIIFYLLLNRTSCQSMRITQMIFSCQLSN